MYVRMNKLHSNDYWDGGRALSDFTITKHIPTYATGILSYMHTYILVHATHALSPKGSQRHLKYSSETPTFYQNYLFMRNLQTWQVVSLLPSDYSLSEVLVHPCCLRHPWKEERGAILLFCPGYHMRHHTIPIVRTIGTYYSPYRNSGGTKA
jgi:hypothetical protein